VSWW